MGPEIALAVAITSAIVSGTAAVASSVEQNRATSRAMRATAQAAQVREQQAAAQAAQQREMLRRERDQIIGRARVAAGVSGTITDGTSFGALINQANMDFVESNNILDQNFRMMVESIRSGADADIASLRGRVRNPLLEGLSGTLGGVSAGLSIGSAGMQIGEAMRRNPGGTR